MPSRPADTAGSSWFRTVPATDDVATIVTKRPAVVPPAGDDLRGRRLGPFELIAPIGVGGMAAVIRATDTALGRPVALKILPPESARDPASVARFRTEARAAAQLDHECVARIYSVGEDQGLHFIAFEYVAGANLKELIDGRGGPLPTADAIGYLRDVAAGLAHAASRGVVHRDLKPSNIIVTPAGRAKIVDMGLARQLDGPADNLTRSGVTLGTFDYISPEQAVEPRLADTRSDIYSLGCTFYHALTGQPPVPDGTAAKKLHHHQQVPPLDPRELNPALPDAVAALLGRMMAKQPDERFQSPDELIAALQALDGPTPAALPALLAPEQRGRGGLIAAGFAVVAVALWAGVAERVRPIVTVPSLSPPTGVTAPAVEASRPQAVPPMPVTRATEPPQPAESVERLRELLAERSVHVTLAPDTVYTLDAPLRWEGQQLTLESADPFRPATLRYAWAAGEDDRPPPFVGVKGGVVAFRDLRFETPATVDGELPPAVVLADRPERLELERCQFPPPDRGEPGRGHASVEVQGMADPGAVRVAASQFLGGGVGVTLRGRGRCVVEQCQFGPHVAAVLLHDTGREDTTLRFEHCSFLLDGGAVVVADEGAGASVRAGHCVASRPGGTGRAALVRHTGMKRGELRWQARSVDGVPQRNAYHNLAAIVDDATTTPPTVAATLADAKAPRWAFAEGDAVELAQSPWQAADPLALLAARPAEAFALNPLLPALRLPTPAGLLGAVQGVRGRLIPSPLPPLPATAAIAASKTVDPSQPTNATLGTYRTLAAALAEAQPDDALLLKFNDAVAIDPVRLDRADARLTLRAFPGYRPTLTLAGTLDADAALFRLHDGQATFEGVHFRLRPARSDFRAQAVVSLTGAGQCEFSGCTVTLDEVDDAQLAVVTLPDAESMMRAAGDRKTAAVRWLGSVARGRGDLVSARGGRRCEIDVERSLVALDGSLLTVAGSGRDLSGAMHQNTLRLRRSTVWLTENLLTLRAAREEERHGTGLLPWQVQAEESVFASGAGKPLVRLDGFDAEDAVKQLLAWASGRGNVYANFGGPVLELRPYGPERMTPAPSYDAARWLAFAHERDSAQPFVRVRFAGVAAGGERAATRFQPADFAAAGVEAGSGAALDGLPRPPEDELP